MCQVDAGTSGGAIMPAKEQAASLCGAVHVGCGQREEFLPSLCPVSLRLPQDDQLPL